MTESTARWPVVPSDAASYPRDVQHAVFTLRQFWLPDVPALTLEVLYVADDAGQRWLAVGEAGWAGEGAVTLEALRAQAGRAGLPVFCLDQALPLQPVHIPKPWGQEIWYTGIEARGLSRVGSAACAIPLPWLLAAASEKVLGHADAVPPLLKILDPLPDEVYGDLYLEMHEEKREVYIVTAVDPRAWPSGTGFIRYGAHPERVAEAGEAGFRAAFLKAIRDYAAIRAELDARLDACRLAEGIGLQAPVDAATLRRWESSLPVELRERERVLREAMNRFTGMRPLRVGDVVKVPLCFPHSLQHGVRTIEFQTPVYERRIISFAQKVLTQSHWDSDYALRHMRLDVPEETVETLAQSTELCLERIVSFEDFDVFRLQLAPGASHDLPANTLVLAMGLQGEAGIGSQHLAPGQALLLPAGSRDRSVRNPSEAPALLVFCLPR